MIACLAISLQNNESRRASLENEMARLGMSCTMIDAVDGATLADPAVWAQLRREFPEYLDGDLADIALLPGQIGCYLSLVRALRHGVGLDAKHMLIVEDDVQFGFDDPAFLEHLTDTSLSWDLIKLAHTEYPLVRGIRTARRTVGDDKFSFYFYWRGIIGTTCNLYTKRGAVKLLKNLPRWGMTAPIDQHIASRRAQMDFLPLFIRPALAHENQALASTIVAGRDNKDAFEQYLHNQSFWRRKRRQLFHIIGDLSRPWQSLRALMHKSSLPWYCCKYLLWRRNKPNPLRRYKLLGSSVVSANTFLFRQFDINIPWLDPLWAVIDVLVGAVYWASHPSQYRVYRWWLKLTHRRFEMRSYAAKPGELTAWRIFCIGRQAVYYGRWLRQHSFNPPTGALMWNGWRSHWALKALRPRGFKTWFFENSPFPACLTMDPQGVNAGSYIPKNPDFYLAWARKNPRPALAWQSLPDVISQRPISPKHLTSDLALIDELPEKFIFVPLQKQDDSQIYLHAGWVRSVNNFIRVIYSCCSELPEGWAVIVKTHPSDNDIEPDVVFQNRPGNVFNGSNFDSIELLKASSGVVNINGSMGLQAYLFEKVSVVLGNSFYGFDNMSRCVNSPEELRAAFAEFDTISFNHELRGCFLNWLLNHYYVKVSDDLPDKIVSGKLRHALLDDETLGQIQDRLLGRWDQWAGLGNDPKRWAKLAHKTSSGSGAKKPPAHKQIATVADKSAAVAAVADRSAKAAIAVKASGKAAKATGVAKVADRSAKATASSKTAGKVAKATGSAKTAGKAVKASTKPVKPATRRAKTADGAVRRASKSVKTA
ncbi:MAG: glycosyltransferase family 25 protein, partial [Proteobacteria bacterium]|nr:glycosyltransferase family 25 protein [Pseudomonadota bacterium]